MNKYVLIVFVLLGAAVGRSEDKGFCHDDGTGFFVLKANDSPGWQEGDSCQSSFFGIEIWVKGSGMPKLPAKKYCKGGATLDDCKKAAANSQ